MEKLQMKNLKKIALILGMVLIIAFLLMVAGDKIKANMIKQNNEAQAYETWLAENCKCLERNRFGCMEGYVLLNKSCVNEQAKTFTNILLGCSKYDCLGEIKLWNNETEKWEN
jgi:hypothetical protein